MILPLLFLALQSAAPQALPSEPIANEITVIGEKLDRFRGFVKSRDGELTCDIRESTGDADIDQIGCAALIGCALEVKPQLDAIAGSDLSRDEKNRQMTEIFEGQIPCISARRDAAVDVLAQQRADAL